MDFFQFIIALVSIVMGCLTLWIIVFYATKERHPKKPGPGTKYDLNQLSSMAESLKDRIDTLESILDAEVPNWREQHEQVPRSTSN